MFWRRRQPIKPISLWDQEPNFNRIMQNIQHTLVDRVRCFMLYQFARQVAHLPGDIAEVGVYKGGTAKLLAKTLPEKQIHLFDTFQGMPPADATLDLHRQGDFADTSLPTVQSHLSDCSNVRFYQGLFPSTAGPIEHLKFSMVHVDADIYESVKACCHFFYERLERNGVMVFDDYGFPTCPGARKAADEYFSDKPDGPLYFPTGQCIVVRTFSSAGSN
jgi:O-methyltransferase